LRLRLVLFLLADLQAARFDQRLEIAQGDRQQAVAFQLDDAEAPGELGKRRILVGAHLQREAPLVGELAPGVVDDVGRQLERVLRALGKRSLEQDAIHEFAALLRVRQRGFDDARGPFERDALREAPGDRRGKRQRHRQDGQALRILGCALATELRLEVAPYAPGDRLVLRGRHARLRLDALAPHEPQRRAVRQPALASEGEKCGIALGGLQLRRPSAARSRLQETKHEVLARIEQRAARFALDEFDRDALRDALRVAVRIGLHGLAAWGRIEAEQEDLFFVDVRALEGQRLHDRRAAGREDKRLAALDRFALLCDKLGPQREFAAQARREVPLEVVDPVARIGPPPRSRSRAFDLERRRQARIAE